MFLHIGGDRVIPKQNIIVIIDMETALKAETTREFVQLARDEGMAEELDTDFDKSKSMIITDAKVYFSPISAATLMKRALVFN